MKKVNFLIYTVAFTSLIASCTSDFEEINTDPNRLEAIGASTLLNPILYNLTDHNSYSAWHNRTAHFMQAIVPYPSTASGGYHRYDVTDDIGTTMWNNHYRWLKNIEEMVTVSEEKNDANYHAIALTLKAWAYANLTDCFGDIPFTQAGKGDEGIDKPVFDKQEDIYKQILADLDQANALYDTSSKSIFTPDLLYSNDFAKWRKLTNSLHVRMLLRVSNVMPSATQKINEILSNPAVYPVFTSSADDAILINTGVAPNLTPWPRIMDYAANKKLSSFFIDNLLEMNDPRLQLWATQATDLQGKAIGYKGIPSGYSEGENAFNYNPSAPNDKVALAPMKSIIMTYGELAFIKAELAFKGQLAGNPEDFYKEGVKAAMNVWGITMPDTYFDNPVTQYNNTLEQIMLQKYYALYFTDNQTWMDYRRTGFPKLPLQPNLYNNGVMPNRYPYPPNVKMQNTENYDAAVQVMGGDGLNTKVWWERF
ncbi:SusD/RagB family nutrient-binding outer membrane lipoprotein [Flavobacterium agricola]|uniref:SusD/RagB family nutrient-binding outer membrane lipoprotein n=1 Tax=Flavobacterium agricola TaxID=2870839 RepID=A0ABY6LYE7_9FLAO|nr:SusD/RagB family nutrient-binding outer membrane lipoprotein [Flavobacterium agricola]UYW01007.1 SusD/RagB family nutrient-binding outer membrane lipoprotein [Flavobacterium agricola]